MKVKIHKCTWSKEERKQMMWEQQVLKAWTCPPWSRYGRCWWGWDHETKMADWAQLLVPITMKTYQNTWCGYSCKRAGAEEDGQQNNGWWFLEDRRSVSACIQHDQWLRMSRRNYIRLRQYFSGYNNIRYKVVYRCNITSLYVWPYRCPLMSY